MPASSRLPGLYRLTLDERLERLRSEHVLDDASIKALVHGLSMELADDLSENVVGRFMLPLGLATNFIVNGHERIVPMVTEESSVVAAASHGAKLARETGGFSAKGAEPEMVGQVHLVDVDAYQAKAQLDAVEREVLEAITDRESAMVRRGGGPKQLTSRVLTLSGGREALVVEIVVDVRDAMGANHVNAVAERAAPVLADITGGRPLLRILTNLAERRTVRVKARFPSEALGGETVVRDIVLANDLAKADPFRATTHNKGIMNGITAVALATGNDTRAVEAGAHAFAARSGVYGPLTEYRADERGDLVGSLEVPLALGTVGGVTRVHPQAQVALALMGVTGARELAHVAGAVGLAQNVAALRALVAEGIQAGHMSLHAVNLARQAGVPEKLLAAVARRMVDENDVSEAAARRIGKGLGGRF